MVVTNFYHFCVPPSFSSFSSWWIVVCLLGSVLFGRFSFSFLHILCSWCFLSSITLDHLVGLTNLEFVVVIVIMEGVVCSVFCSLNWIQSWFFLLLWLFVSWCCSSLLAWSWFVCVVDDDDDDFGWCIFQMRSLKENKDAAKACMSMEE